MDSPFFARGKRASAQIPPFSKLQIVDNKQSYFLGREIWDRLSGVFGSI